MKGEDIREWEELKDIYTSTGWRIFRNLVVKHRQFLIERSNKYLKNYEDRKAGEFLAKAEETTAILSLVSNRLAELTKTIEENK